MEVLIGDPQNHGFQYSNGLMTWMIWGPIFLGVGLFSYNKGLDGHQFIKRGSYVFIYQLLGICNEALMIVGSPEPLKTVFWAWRMWDSTGRTIICLDMEISWNKGTPKSSYFNGIFPYEPSIWGYPQFGNPPYVGISMNFVEGVIFSKNLTWICPVAGGYPWQFWYVKRYGSRFRSGYFPHQTCLLTGIYSTISYPSRTMYL